MIFCTQEKTSQTPDTSDEKELLIAIGSFQPVDGVGSWFIPLFTRALPPSKRWLALGFLNQQQYERRKNDEIYNTMIESGQIIMFHQGF